MRRFSRLMGILLSAAIFMQTLPAVSAEQTANSNDTNYTNVNDTIIESYEAEAESDVDDSAEYTEGETDDSGILLPVTPDDPTYEKYLNSLMPQKARAVWGSGSITHQSRFASSQKVYGIDVSYYQGKIDWAKVKQSGIDFVIVRVGYRGYGSAGTLVEDPNFRTYIEGASKAGLKVGAYFYTQAINTWEAAQEAQFVLDRVKGYDLQMPIYYDIESVDYDSGRLDNAGLSKAQKTNLCKSFCDTILKAGYDSGVYASYAWFTWMLDGKALGQSYPIWLAHYASYTNYSDRLDIWQYTGNGSVSGVQTYIDINVWYPDSSVPSTVTGVKSVSNTSTSNTISWNSCPNVDGYEVYQWIGTNNTYKLLTTTKNTSYTNAGKSSATMYKYRIRAYRTDSTGVKRYGQYSDDLTTCTLPTAVKITSSSAYMNTATLSWSKVSKATDYQIELNIGGVWTVVGTTSGTSYTASNLTQSGDNQFRVRARRYYDGTYYNGAYGYATVKLTIPSKVTGIKSSNTSTSNKLTWNKADNAEGYEVYQWIGTTNSYKLIGTVTSAAYTNSGKSTATMYKYKIRAYNTVSGQKQYGTFSDEFTTCTLPANVSFAQSSTAVTSITVNWNSVSKATSYQIEMKTNGSWKTLATSSARSYTVKNLTANNSYEFRVRAIRNYGGVNYYGGYTTKTIKITLPAKPSSVKTSFNTVNTNGLCWGKVSNAKGYEVYQWIGTNDTYKKLATVTATTYTNSGKSSATMYNYRIRAYTAPVDGVVHYSDYSEYTTCTLPDTVMTKASSRSGSSATLNWNKVSKATGYQVYLKNGSSWKYLGATSKLTYTAKSLSSGSQVFRIRAYRTYGGVKYYGGYAQITVV
ncbi:GH25 family lysozyme [Ruminococcus sp.]|uniref:GH25 family lysozyme n=1 Tax=Ruminococcus sp. TaxID=41978 RepID=UPI0025E074BF|nr:GH25 family lysozyme [Ruminococcus sp.]